VSGFDLPHVLSAARSPHCRFGKGRRFANSGGLLNYIIGNWQLNGILTLTSGRPIQCVHLIGHPQCRQFRSSTGNVRRIWLENLTWQTRAPVNGLTLLLLLHRRIYIWQFRQEFTSSGLVQEFGPVHCSRIFHSMKRGAFSSGRGVQRYKYTNMGNSRQRPEQSTKLGSINSTRSTERQLQLSLKLYF